MEKSGKALYTWNAVVGPPKTLSAVAKLARARAAEVSVKSIAGVCVGAVEAESVGGVTVVRIWGEEQRAGQNERTRSSLTGQRVIALGYFWFSKGD